MAFRVAKSLLALRAQVDAMAPNRDKSSDGTIGDQSHQARNSDHNPDANGVVTAMDITHDPSHGVDAGALAEMLRLSRDPRIKYVISNARIFSSRNTPWVWRPYTGANAHTKHVHISVIDEAALYDDTAPWSIEKRALVRAPMQGASATRFSNITATMFGGQLDPNNSAYDNHIITDSELGVALPFHFQGARPKVRVINSLTGKSVVCDIVDVGPWNTDDPYWTIGSRPQAESGVDRRGRPTNLAGIDLTPAAARAIGIDGKGKVDWEFAGASVIKPDGGPMGTPANDIVTLLEKVLALLQALQKPQAATPDQTATTTPTQMQPADLKKIVDIIGAIAGTGSQPLGQVNGALGETIGNLLNGKKTAIGTIGALVTSLLSGAPGISGALAPLLGLASTTPVAPIALPIFLAMAGWGVLGKLEKWTQPPAQK